MRRVRTASEPTAPDEGSALLITMMVMAVLMVLGTTIVAVTANNVSSSRRALDAGAALDAADAGVAQALAYLRSTGPSALDCSPGCPSNPWGNQDAPQTVDVPGSDRSQYQVWIEPVPATDPSFYRVHSFGTSGTGARSVQVDATLIPGMNRVPLGVFARTIEGGGSASVTRESVFSTGCVYNRSKIEMGTSIDAAYDIRAAVHSARIVTDSNGNTSNCPATDKKAVHQSGTCNTQYPYDQDTNGGPSTKPACDGATRYPQYYAPRDLDGNGSIDVNGSYLRDAAALMKVFNITDQPFTPAQLDNLRNVARSQGNYWTEASGWTSPDPAVTPHAVLFFDLLADDPGGTVDLNDVEGWGRPKNLGADDAACPKRSLLIIIEGGNAKMNSNQQLSASLVLTSKAPYGVVTHSNGTADFIGTIFADHVNLVGNFDTSLDKCFIANLSPALYSIEVENYREIDR